MLNRLADDYPDQVQIIYRHFPLNQIHTHAQITAEAAEAAGGQGAFWEFHEALYARQKEWANLDESGIREFLSDLAEELNIDADRLLSDLDTGKYSDYVSSLEQEAILLSLPGTPAVIMDGQVIAGQGLPFDFAIWQQFIESSIQVNALQGEQFEQPPAMTLQEGGTYFAYIVLESGDQIVIELNAKAAPLTVNSFVFLSEQKWYDGVTFHRVLPGFMAQTGDPTGTGQGGPGYQLPNEIDSSLSHNEAGIVAMANSGPDTNGSQFFITLADASHLDGNYTIFGRVVEGMSVVESI
ncbi:MAG: peptidylprolyl isomerase, partial [Methylococcales bacterium]|nr:peptidylprolyl isomerase [Methylococcales bacterium]